MNLLLLSIGRRVELLKAFRAAFAKLNIRGRIITTDISPLNPAWYLGDARYILPRVEDSETRFLQALFDVCTREQIHLIVPIIDQDLLILAQQRAEFQSRGIRVLVSPPEAIAIATNKLRVFQFLHTNGWDTPQVMDLETARTHTLPLFIKPEFASGAVNSHKIHSRNDLEYYARTVPDPVIQEFVEGTEITTDIFSDWDARVITSVPRRRLKLKAGEVSIGRVERDVRLEMLCSDIARKLGTIGPINIQVIRAGEKFYVTDINARFAGGIPLSIQAGAPMHEWVIRMGLGQSIAHETVALDDGLVMMRYDESIFFKPAELETW